MDNKKLAELMRDEPFMKEILEATTVKEVKGLFKERGVEITDSDIEFLAKVIAQVDKNEGKISEEDLENISGGVENYSDLAAGLSIGLGIGAIATAYAFKKGQDYALSWWKTFHMNNTQGSAPMSK
jgi:hypothetical protein